MEEDGSINNYVKQEQARLRRHKNRLLKNLGGVRHLDTAPDAMFVIDLKREHIAVAEARKLKIPIAAIVDTNCDPDLVTIPVPGNDDAIRSIRIFLQVITETIVQAKAEYEAKHGPRRQPEMPVTAIPAPEEPKPSPEQSGPAEAEPATAPAKPEEPTTPAAAEPEPAQA